jgi:hypothetical protein
VNSRNPLLPQRFLPQSPLRLAKDTLGARRWLCCCGHTSEIIRRLDWRKAFNDFEALTSGWGTADWKVNAPPWPSADEAQDADGYERKRPGRPVAGMGPPPP